MRALILLTAGALALAACQPAHDYDVDNNVIVVDGNDPAVDVTVNKDELHCDDPKTRPHEVCQ